MHDYLQRVSSTAPVPLGREPVRYYEFSAADHAAAPTPPDPRWEPLGARHESLPLLPQAPAGHGETRFHVIFRLMLEDVALTGDIDEWDRLEILGAMDSLQVGYRAELGRTVLEFLAEVQRAPDSHQAWRFRSLRWPDRPLLLFGAATRLDASFQSAFADWVSLRHQQHLELIPEYGQRITVGVLLTPRQDDLRPWDITLAAVRGDQGFLPKARRVLELLWPLPPTEPDWDAVRAAYAEAEAEAGSGEPS